MHYNSKRNDNPYCSQSICFLKIFSGNCFAFFDSYPSFVSYQKLHHLWRLQTLLLNPYSEIGTSSIWKFFWSYWLSSIMPGRLTAIAIIGCTSLRLISAQFDCELLCRQCFILYGTLFPDFRLLSPFQLRPSRFSGLYIGKISSFGNSAPLFYCFVLSSYGACRGRSPLVCRTPAFLFAGVCPFSVCRAQTHARAERGTWCGSFLLS